MLRLVVADLLEAFLMNPGLISVLAFLAAAGLAMAARWRSAFWFLSLSSLLSGFFYGLVWFFERQSERKLQQLSEDTGVVFGPGTYNPSLGDMLMEFQHAVLFCIFGSGLLMFFFATYLEKRRR